MLDNSVSIQLSNFHRSVFKIFSPSLIGALKGRGDSLISALRKGPAANGRGLCDIDRVFSELNHQSENWEVLAREKYTNDFSFSILIIIGLFRRARTSQFSDW